MTGTSKLPGSGMRAFLSNSLLQSKDGEGIECYSIRRDSVAQDVSR